MSRALSFTKPLFGTMWQLIVKQVTVQLLLVWNALALWFFVSESVKLLFNKGMLHFISAIKHVWRWLHPSLVLPSRSFWCLGLIRWLKQNAWALFLIHLKTFEASKLSNVPWFLSQSIALRIDRPCSAKVFQVVSVTHVACQGTSGCQDLNLTSNRLRAGTVHVVCSNAVGSVLLSLLWTVFRWIFKNWFQVFTAKSNAVTCPTGYYIAVLWLFMCVIVASYLGQSFSSLVSLLSFAHCLATKPMAFPKLADAVCKAKRRGVTPSTLGKRWFIVEALKSKYTCMVLKELIQHCLADSAISVWSKRTWETRAQFVRKVLRNIASFLGRSDCLEVWRAPLIWDNCHVECHMLICVQKNQGLELCLHMLFLKAFCAIGWRSLLSNKMVEHVCLRMQAD